MDRSRRFQIPSIVVLLAIVLAACGQASGGTGGNAGGTGGGTAATTAPQGGSAATAAPQADAAGGGQQAAGGDLLADVKQRGILRIATDANYKPQSFRNPDGSWDGFDIDVGREIAKRLGVEAEFMNISWDVITAGSWNARWDINIGSMTVTPDRKQLLLFTSPYYYTPAAFAVHRDSQAASVADLAGKKVGVGAATTYQEYLNGTLKLENETIVTPPPQGATVQVYETDQLALQDLALGSGTRLDAALTALPTIQSAISGGQPFKVLADPVYYEVLAVALDQKSPMNSQPLRDEISRAIDQMHQDGTLTNLSNKHYGIDLTKKR